MSESVQTSTATLPTNIVDAALQSGRMEVIHVGAEPPQPTKESEVMPVLKPKHRAMKAQITAKNYAAVIAITKPFVSQRSPLPILANVHLAFDKHSLTVSGTDLDCSIQARVECESNGKGETTLPVKPLFDGLKALSTTGSLHIELGEKEQTTLSFASGSTSLLGLPAEDYPRMPQVKADRTVTLPQSEFRKLLQRVKAAQSTDSTRYVLNGVYLEVKDGALRAVATDGRRLHLMEVPCISNGGKFSLIVSSGTIDKVFRLLTGPGDVEIGFKEAVKSSWGMVQFTFTTQTGKGERAVNVPVVIASKVIEGTYPNYPQVIPHECKVRVGLPREAFAKNIATVAKAGGYTLKGSSYSDRSVKLSFVGKVLTISGSNAEGQSSAVTMELGGALPKDMAIAFAPGKLYEAFQSSDEAVLFMELTDELSPCKIISKTEPLQIVVMPCRLN